MPAPTNAEEFLHLLRKSKLLNEEQIATWSAKMPNVATLTPEALAQELRDAKLLTKFHTDQLLLGKYQGFFLGKYRLLGKLGAGGMGVVFLAEQTNMKRKVALKLLPPKLAKNPQAKERFFREARAVGTLSHPNIVHAFDLEHVGGIDFLVMEYVEGISLHDLVKQNGTLTPDQVGNFLWQAALGLQHAHEAGLVHRDVKPSNLLLDKQGVIKLLDLGLARFFTDEEDELTKQGEDKKVMMGTADYLAPEQAIDSHQVDIRADIYSLGATAYYLLTGKPPFGGETVTQKLLAHQMKPPTPIRELRPDVPALLADVIAKMLAKAPEERYQVPAEIAVDLSPWGQMTISGDVDLQGALSGVLVAAKSDGPLSSSGSSSSTNLSGRLQAAGYAALRSSVAVQTRKQAVGQAPSSTTIPTVIPAQAPKKSRLPGFLVGGVLLLVAAVAAAWQFKLPPFAADPVADTSKPADPIDKTTELIVGPDGYRTLREALENAKSGDTIIVRNALFEKPVVIDGTSGLNRLTIIGETKAKYPITWGPSDEHTPDDPLLVIRNIPDLTIRGFRLQSGNRLKKLIRVSGSNPNLHLDDIQAAAPLVETVVRFDSAGRSEAKPMRLSRWRVTLDGTSTTRMIELAGTKDAPTANLIIEDCRFEGINRKGTAVQALGAVRELLIRRCRFFRLESGLRCEADQPDVVRTFVAAQNVFADNSAAVRLDRLPTPVEADNRLVLERNLFLNRTQPITVSNIPPTPLSLPVQGIWFPEGNPLKDAGTQPRYFRKTFTLDEVGPASLDLIADSKGTVYVNGQKVCEHEWLRSGRMAAQADITPFLKPGVNVLAVEAQNVLPPTAKAKGACLFVFARIQQKQKAPLEIGTDKTWQASGTATENWRTAATVSGNWVPAKELLPFNTTPYHNLVLLSEIDRQFPGYRSAPFVIDDRNVRDLSSTASWLLPTCQAMEFPPLAQDPTLEKSFLRYSISHPLAQIAAPPGLPLDAVEVPTR